MSLVARVRNLVKKNKETLAGLERALGFSQSSIRKWDDSAPSTDKIQKVAEYFDVSVDYLLGRTDDPRMRDKEEFSCNVTEDERAAVKAFLKAYREQKNKA